MPGEMEGEDHSRVLVLKENHNVMNWEAQDKNMDNLWARPLRKPILHQGS